MKREYRRHLPHQIPDGVPIFVTWNLKGAIPRAVVDRSRRERARLANEPRLPGESDSDRAVRHSKLLFALADRFLDACNDGPSFLREPAAAEILEAAICVNSVENCILWAWCIMSNHVHVLFTPKIEFSKLMQSLKGGTSFNLNRLHDEQGRVVWQDESYDHWVRDEEEMHRIIHYIETNPVKARLCAQPSDWPYSSARFRTKWPPGTPYVGQTSA
jgi:REP element-mobilizing transposase RayT